MSGHSFLSQEQAIKRFNLFGSQPKIHYEICLHLPKGSLVYRGFVKVTFNLINISDDLFLDFNCRKEVEAFIVNGAKLESSNQYKEYLKEIHLLVPKESIKLGNNEIIVVFANEYTRAKGLYSFQDVDGSQVIWSLSEPYHGNKIFPMFDQPDLRATFDFSLIVDKSWMCINHEKLKLTEEKIPDHLKEYFKSLGNNEIYHEFETTKPIPTYLFVIIAGDYKEIICKEKYKGIEFRLFVRPALYKSLLDQADNWFYITRKGFEFYEEFFGTPYPFSTRYDQIMCPEYSSGAMETPGVVTFTENYVFKDPPSSELRTQTTKVILHELAHHWFGDLVTIKWWNDLWIKESFADFSAFTVMQNVEFPLIEDPMLLLFINKVRRAYSADAKPTTHSICAEVQNTEKASLVFDGITYIKGAASLLQLLKLIGRETFSKAMKAFFEKHKWGAATLDDFISNFNEFVKDHDPESPFSLESWKNDWLLKPGLSQIEVKWNRDDSNTNAKLQLIQSSCLNEFPAHRFIKTKVGFFAADGTLIEAKDVIIKKQVTEVEYDGSKSPAFVFPNYHDEGYVKTIIDESSKPHLIKSISKVKDDPTRGVMWYCLFNMLVDGQMNSLDFIDSALNGLQNERSGIINQGLFEYLAQAVSLYTPKKLRHLVSYKIFDSFYRLILKVDSSESNRLLLLKRELIKYAKEE